MEFRRYALYYAPRLDEALHAFGRSWLGWDPDAATAVPPEPLAGMSAAAHAGLIAAPRRYALHGTLKPPFALAEGKDFNALRSAVARLAAESAPVDLGTLEVAELGRFLALRPAAEVPGLSELASRCMMDLDPFRAPPSESELARRRAAGLTPAQDAHLVRWGYPYVMDQFRFHVTLTGPIEDPVQRAEIGDLLTARMASVLAEPVVLADLCLYGDPGGETPFSRLESFSLSA